MKRKIIGATVGSPLPKPNLMQTDPAKGDYVKGKEGFLESVDLDGYVRSVNGAAPDENGNVVVSGGNVDQVSVEPAIEDIPKVFFVGEAPTTKAQGELPLTMEYISKSNRIFSYVTLKVQGDSSAGYAKKNFNLKMFSDEAREEKLKCAFRDWSKTHKYCLKANWIDHTHARNVVGGRLWGQIVNSRADYDSYPSEYRESANCGAVDGFPVKVYLNGVYQGLYTWNIRKDSSMFNMDDETGTHAALIADANSNVTVWRTLPNIDGTDWTDELNDIVPDAVKSGFRDAYSFVMNSTDEEFKANIGQHFYLSSLIDYYIYVYSILMIGGLAKSQTMFTYDGVKFLANIYDMDTTWALTWNGSGFYDIETACPSGYTAKTEVGQNNLLYERLAYLFVSELKERFFELRQTVLSDANIINEFERFMDVIPSDLYAEDFAETTANGAFTAIPSATTNNLQKLREIIVKRMAYVEAQFDAMVARIPATGITLDASELTFSGIESKTLTATVTPADSTDDVVWITSDPTIASVADGVVTSVGNGECIITATAGGFSATCAVLVNSAGDVSDGYVTEGMEFRLDAIRNTLDGNDTLVGANWADVSGNGHATTLAGSSNTIRWGDFGASGSFSVKVTDPTEILARMNKAFTVEVLTTAESRSGTAVFTAGKNVQLMKSNGQCKDSSGYIGTAFTAAGALSCAMVFDGANITIYHNGVQVASSTAAFDFTEGTTLEVFGFSAWSQQNSFVRHAARLYSRPLAAEEIKANYDNDAARFGLN